MWQDTFDSINLKWDSKITNKFPFDASTYCWFGDFILRKNDLESVMQLIYDFLKFRSIFLAKPGMQNNGNVVSQNELYCLLFHHSIKLPKKMIKFLWQGEIIFPQVKNDDTRFLPLPGKISLSRSRNIQLSNSTLWYIYKDPDVMACLFFIFCVSSLTYFFKFHTNMTIISTSKEMLLKL